MNANSLIKISDYKISDLQKQKTLVFVDKLEIFSKRILSVVGEIGSGKSLLFKGIVRLVDSKYYPNLLIEGKVEHTEAVFVRKEKTTFKRTDIQQYGSTKLSNYRRKVQMIIQEPERALNPGISVYNTLKEAIGLSKKIICRSEVKDFLIEHLETLGLNNDSILRRKVGLLSGGEKRRLTVLRAMLMNPSIIIADEPLSELDRPNREIILKKFIEYVKEGGSLIFISHDIPEILDFGRLNDSDSIPQYITLMEKGMLIKPIRNEGRVLLTKASLPLEYSEFFRHVSKRWPNY